MFRKALLTTAAAIAMFALSSVARADTITLTGINGTGVTATVSNYSLSGNTFTFTINNTSVAPGTTGVITNIGFALPGTRPNNYTLVSSSNSNYFLAFDLNATAGSQNIVSSFDLVLMDKSNGNSTFGGGSVNNGIAGGTSATFVITGDFSGLTADQVARSIFARFQNVNPGGSDVAGNPGTPGTVPEPMTMILFGTGLAGIAARARRRRATKA
ncbi:MAG: PEP-CTERM sorting domain-containing protein [Pyrinomonadaceae bacterium]